jgi:hypothetical protein
MGEMTAVVARGRRDPEGRWKAGDGQKKDRLVDLQGGGFDLSSNMLPAQ